VLDCLSATLSRDDEEFIAYDGDFYRVSKSSVLSHLFLQAANSCELLRRSDEARAQLAALIRQRARNERIVASITAAHLAAERQRDQVEVAFAFLGDWHGRTVASLPLFSRISLVTQGPPALKRPEASGAQKT